MVGRETESSLMKKDKRYEFNQFELITALISQDNKIKSLNRIIDSQRETIQKLVSRMKLLEKQLKVFDNEHTPSSKKRKRNSERDPSKPRFPGKPRGSAGGGVQLPPPDKTEDHTLDACSCCDNHELKLVRVRTKKVLDLPEKPIICTEHRLYEYYCDQCNKTITPDVSLPNSIYGGRLQAASMLLKKAGLSFSTIAHFWRAFGAPSLSAPSILRFTDKASNFLSKTRGAFLRAAKKCFVGHKDETGMRKDGLHGHIGGLFTEQHAIYNATRGRTESIDTLKGNKISVVDGFIAYKNHGLLQRCWAHLLRTAKRLKDDHEELEDQYQRLKTLYEQLTEWVKDPPDNERYKTALWTLNDIANVLHSRGTAGKQLETHILNGGTDWLTALRYPRVPLTNNHAERMIRPAVILRKMMGCYRNNKGKRFINIILSVLQTWELRRINTFQKLTTILT